MESNKMVYVIISVLILSLSLPPAVIAGSSVEKERQDARFDELVAKKVAIGPSVDEVIAYPGDEELQEVAIAEYQAGLRNTIAAKREEIANLESQIVIELKFFETILFERNELSFLEKIAFDRIVQFIQNSLQRCNDSKDSDSIRALIITESLVAYAHQLLLLTKEVFMRLECLTVGRHEIGESYGALSMPLSAKEVKSIVLKVACSLLENFEEFLISLKMYYENTAIEVANGCFDFSLNNWLSESTEMKQLLLNTIVSSLPEYLQVTWMNTLVVGGSGKKRAQEFLVVQFSVELQEAYAKFLYEVWDAKKTSNYEAALKALEVAQGLINSSKALCIDKDKIEFRVLRIWDFKLRKMAVQLEMSRKAKEFCTTPDKQGILIKHQIICNDVMLRGLVGQDREFAEYFDRYSRLVELYLFSKEASPNLMVDLYELTNQIKRMLEVNAQIEGGDALWTGIPVDHLAGFSWIKTAVWKITTLNSEYIKKQICYWFYPPNLKKIYLTDMNARLKDVARAVNNKVTESKPADSSGVASILHGDWAKQSDYGGMIKDFLGQAVQGQAQTWKAPMMQMLGYASPVVVMAILKYIMPSLSGTIKQSVSDLLASMSNDSQVAQKADSFSQPVKEKVAEFLKNTPGLFDGVKPEQVAGLVAQVEAA